ncbi:MAG TPA: glutathione S-transferase N-terminal domain-containing protein, partial [Usitatibacter sp.]|nr:glutathione S-transferase N-terminal domain-containing protein [Usitatibacter sp.]
MKLVGSLTSPYVRKVRVLLAEKGLAYELVEDNAWHAQTTVPRYNPLNKVPALVMD